MIGMKIQQNCDQVLYVDCSQYALEIFHASESYSKQVYGMSLVLDGEIESATLRHAARQHKLGFNISDVEAAFEHWLVNLKRVRENIDILFPDGAKGVLYLRCNGKSRNQLAKILARYIHLEPYAEFDFNSALLSLPTRKST